MSWEFGEGFEGYSHLRKGATQDKGMILLVGLSRGIFL